MLSLGESTRLLIVEGPSDEEEDVEPEEEINVPPQRSEHPVGATWGMDFEGEQDLEAYQKKMDREDAVEDDFER